MEKEMATTPVILPGESHGQTRLAGYSIQGRKSRTQLSTQTEFNGEGNGNPLQYSCLENPMDGGAWQAAVHWVAKSQTQLSDFTFTFHFYALEKEMATHSSVLAWRIPGTGEPGGLPSMGSQRTGLTTQQQQQHSSKASILWHSPSLWSNSFITFYPHFLVLTEWGTCRIFIYILPSL